MDFNLLPDRSKTRVDGIAVLLRDWIVVYTDGVNDLLLDAFPFFPCALSGVFARYCRLIEQFVQGDGRFVLVSVCNSFPESEGCLLVRGYRLKILYSSAIQ